MVTKFISRKLNPNTKYEIKDKSFLDWIGFGNCTHALLDGTCFIEGDYEILNEAELHLFVYKKRATLAATKSWGLPTEPWIFFLDKKGIPYTMMIFNKDVLRDKFYSESERALYNIIDWTKFLFYKDKNK